MTFSLFLTSYFYGFIILIYFKMLYIHLKKKKAPQKIKSVLSIFLKHSKTLCFEVLLSTYTINKTHKECFLVTMFKRS
jgi:hypothetical protein